MKKILVTGASGFIGTYVVEELLKYKVEVIASSSNIEKATKTKWYSRVTYIPFDLGDYRGTDNYFKFFCEPDVLIHLAWQGLPNYKSQVHTDINLPQHTAFLTNLIQNGLQDITITGTCLEYGIREGGLSEDMPPMPSNSYAVAKDSLRDFLQRIQDEYSFSFKWIRLFYMYGKGQNPNSLLSQLDKALEKGNEVFNMSGGQQLRDYLPVEKVAEYIVKIATQNDVTGIINCCSGQPITVKKFVEDYLKSNHKHIKLNLGCYPYNDYEPMHFWGENRKLKSIIDE